MPDCKPGFLSLSKTSPLPTQAELTGMSAADDLQATQLAEANHRARNNLATIAAMLQLQARLCADEAASAALEAARLRVMAIARVNAALDNTARTEPVVNAQEFLLGIASDLQEATQGGLISVRPPGGPMVFLPVRYARPLGLVANEWVTNALKHAFPGQRHGTVAIELYCEDGHCHLAVIDDGTGMDPAQVSQSTGLGTRLIKGLARQISGSIKSEAGAEGGTSWILSFPKP